MAIGDQFEGAAWKAESVVNQGDVPTLDDAGKKKVGTLYTPGGGSQSSIINIDSCGVCDETRQDDVLATQWGLYSTGYFGFVLETGIPGALINSQATPLSIFVTGQGETPSGIDTASGAAIPLTNQNQNQNSGVNEAYPFPLGQEHTNILRSGFPATGESFVCTGVSVHIGSPVVFGFNLGPGIIPVGPISIPALNLGNGVYRQTIVERMRDGLALQITFDQGTRNNILQLGPLSWMPDFLSGGTEIGYTSMVHSFAMPFVVSRPTNSQQDAPQVQLVLSAGISMTQDTSVPLAAQLIEALGAVGSAKVFYVPIKVTLLGVRFCYQQVCAPDNGEISQLKEEMARLKAMYAQKAQR